MEKQSFHLDIDDFNFLEQRFNEQYNDSKFDFLSEHKGIRNGQLHMLIGTTGSGKSTLTRSIIIDSAYSKKIVVWISEETTRDYSFFCNKITHDKAIIDNIMFLSERDIPIRFKDNIKDFMFYFKEKVMNYAPDILFIDNLTTSFMYSELVGIKGQGYTSEFLTAFAADQFLPIFCIAHTKKDVLDNGNKLIDISDIRGCSAISNTSSYAYTLQVFRNGNIRFPILSIQKSRYHEIKNKYFLLHYENGTYFKSTPIGMDHINSLFQLRDRLTDNNSNKNIKQRSNQK